MVSLIDKIRKVFKKFGKEDYIINGINDFKYLLEETEDRCKLFNRRFLINIGHAPVSDIQVFNTRVLVDNGLLENLKIYQEYSYSVYVIFDKKSEKMIRFKNSNIFHKFSSLLKVGNKEGFHFISKEKKIVSDILTSILINVNSYEMETNIGASLAYWSTKESGLFNLDSSDSDYR